MVGRQTGSGESINPDSCSQREDSMSFRIKGIHLRSPNVVILIIKKHTYLDLGQHLSVCFCVCSLVLGG